MIDIIPLWIKRTIPYLNHCRNKKLLFNNDKLSQNEEEEFKQRKETGAQKSMNEFRKLTEDYKDKLKKRKASEIYSSQTETQEQQEPEVYKVKRIKTEVERQLELDMESEQDESEETPESQDQSKSVPNVNKSLESISRRREEMTKQMNSRLKGSHADKLAQQKKSKDYLNMFKTKSRQINKSKAKAAKVEIKQVEENPDDFDSVINRTYKPSNVQVINRENDPTYELNNDILNYDQEKLKQFKKQKIKFVNQDLNFDQNLQKIDEQMQDVDITKAENQDPNVKDVHPMDSDKLVFMDTLPITTKFDTSDVNVTLDITSLPQIIEKEKIRYQQMEQKKSDLEERKQKGKNSKFDSTNMDKNIIDIDEHKLDMMFDKEDFRKLRIIGQFNLGFILAVRSDTNQLFILDQHATAEK